MNTIQPGLYSFNAGFFVFLLLLLSLLVFFLEAGHPQRQNYLGPTKVLVQPWVTFPLKIKTAQDQLVNYPGKFTKIHTLSIRA